MIDPTHELTDHTSNPKRTSFVARDSILKLLSETELAQVSNAEGASKLPAASEYIDLENLQRGVRTAPVEADAASRMLPRSAVSDETWRKILAVLVMVA